MFSHHKTHNNETTAGSNINSAQGQHTTKTGAALDPTDTRTGINSGAGNGYNNNGYSDGVGAGNEHYHPHNDNSGVHGHSTRTGAALDPTDNRAGINSGNNNNNNNNNSGYPPPSSDYANQGNGASGLTGNQGNTTGAGGGTGLTGAQHGTTGGGGGAGLTGSQYDNGTINNSGGGVGTGQHHGHHDHQHHTGTGIGGGQAQNSQALKDLSEQKAREAAGLQKQSAELGEAERLEQEALQARERAVAHGAHPAHGNLRGGQGL